MTVTGLLLISLLVAVTGVEHKFVKYKTDLLLNINKSGNLDYPIFSWKFNSSVNVVQFISGQAPNLYDYKTRAEFFQQNYSLLLKDMQHNDSGYYKAVVSRNTDVTIVEYQVTVLDPVSPVNLIINSVVSDVCNVTVTCRTEDSLISKTFQCDNKSCSLVSKPDNIAIPSTPNVYVQQDYIICNHSNQVSSEQDKINFKAQCETTAVSAAIPAGVTVGVLLVAIIISSIALCIYCKRKRSDKTLPQSTDPTPNTYENPAVVSPAVSPTTTYSMVQFPKRHAQEEESRNKNESMTVYAQINRVSKPNSEAPTVNS